MGVRVKGGPNLANELTKQDQIPAETCRFHAEFLGMLTPDPVGTLGLEPNTDGNPRRSAWFWGNSDEIRADFAPVQGVVFAAFWPVETNSVSIVGWQSNESIAQ